MLGRNWRLRAFNTQNQAVTVTVTARYFRFSSAGAMEWSTEQTLINAVSVSASTGTTVSDAVDNSGSGWLGMEATASFAAAAATNGSGAVLLTLERSANGGTTWPSANLGAYIGSHTLVSGDGTATLRRNYLVR